jgi:hypothetical protein
MGRRARWVGGIVLAIGLGIAARADPCLLDYSWSTLSLWVSQNNGYLQDVQNEWAIGVKCSRGASVPPNCRGTFAENLYYLNPTTLQYGWVAGRQGNPVDFGCGTSSTQDSGKLDWGLWQFGHYRFIYTLTQAGGGGRNVYEDNQDFVINKD